MGARLDPVMSFPPPDRSRQAGTAAPRHTPPRHVTPAARSLRQPPCPSRQTRCHDSASAIGFAVSGPACGLGTVLLLPGTSISAARHAVAAGAEPEGAVRIPNQTGMGRRSHRRSVRPLTAEMSGANAQSPRAPALPARQNPAPPSRAGNLPDDPALPARPATRAITLWQVPPRRARAQLPQDPVDHLPVITPPIRRRPAAGPPGWPRSPGPVTLRRGRVP
jgi:hypothetical protein